MGIPRPNSTLDTRRARQRRAVGAELIGAGIGGERRGAGIGNRIRRGAGRRRAVTIPQIPGSQNAYFFAGASTTIVTALDGSTMRPLAPRGRAGSAARTKSRGAWPAPETQKV